jgi:hypothetical protein
VDLVLHSVTFWLTAGGAYAALLVRCLRGGE